MLHVGSRSGPGDGEDDLAAFVDRIAAAGSDDATEQARCHIRELIARSATPPGIRRLVEALAASLTDSAAPTPTPEATTVAAAVPDTAMLVVRDFGAAAVARTIATLVDDGRRVLVTGAGADELTEVAARLSPALADRALDVLPDLSPGEQRELRRRLRIGAPVSVASDDRPLPDAASVPSPAAVASLCARAGQAPPLEPAAAMVPALLGSIDHVRREAVTSVARYVHRTLSAMPSRGERPWAWHLLGDLIYGRHRSAFDQLLEDTAQAVGAAERAEFLPPVAVAAPLPPDALEILRRYAEFLFVGGGRGYLRTPQQRRDALPVLRVLQVDGAMPETADDVRRVVEHLELGERLARIDHGCRVVGIPVPRGRQELTALADGLVRVAAAARSVGALRHDVLFLSADSPLAVPDVDAAAQVTAAVLQYAEQGPHADANGRLDRMAADLAMACPTLDLAPEHAAAVRALQVRDAPGYARAVEELGAARRAAYNAARGAALLERLRAVAPRLAASWTSIAPQAGGLGFVCFQPIEVLLTAMPEPDCVDVVIVLGAHRLGVERLLVVAAAPRLVAVVPPGAGADEAGTALGVLQTAAVPTLRERPSPVRKVVPIGQRSVPIPVASRARRAGA